MIDMNRIIALSILSLLLVVTGLLMAHSKAQPKTRIIFDTDIGDDIDDAWALGFILAHKQFDLLGVTAAYGNTPARARIALKMLHLTGRDDVPVSVGRQTSNGFQPQYTWAEDFSLRQPIKEPAADFIIDQVRKYPREVVLVAVGPLENLADVLRKEPNLPNLVKAVVLMSGCIYGTASSSQAIAEWNVRCAIPDSQMVYAAGLPLTIVPLDSTTYVTLSDEERKQVSSHDSRLTFSLECLYRLWLSGPNARMTLHDQLAAVDAAEPGQFFGKTETLPLRVDAQGFTRIDPQKGKPVAVRLQPKRDEFMRYYLDHLSSQHLGN